MSRAARAAHLRIGRLGEAAAEKLLRAKEYTILARDYRLRSGELDIVARDGATIVFVEVKTIRHNPDFEPGQNLSARQIRRIRNAGNAYLKIFAIPDVPSRFDLVEVVVSRSFFPRVLSIRHTLAALEMHYA